jgi:hypothetical protein
MGSAKKVDVDIQQELKAIKEQLRQEGNRGGRGNPEEKFEGVDLEKWRPYAVATTRPGSYGEPRPDHEMQRARDRLQLRKRRYRPASELGIEARHTGIPDCEVWLCPREVWEYRENARKLKFWTGLEPKYKNWRALQKSRSQKGRLALNEQEIAALAAQQE